MNSAAVVPGSREHPRTVSAAGVWRLPGLVSAGLVWGLLTSLGQTYLPEPLVQLTNCYSAWLIIAYFVGYLSVTSGLAAVAGLLAVLDADVGFYVGMWAQFGTIGSWTGDTYYMIGALMFGPLLGLAGYLFTTRSRWATYGVALMASLFFSEALYRLSKTDVVTAGFSDGWYVFAVLGLGLLLATLPRTRHRPLPLLSIIPLTALAFVGVAIVLPFVLSLI